MYFNYIENADPEISALIRSEMDRQESKIEMIDVYKRQVTNRHLSAGDYFDRLAKIAASDADAVILREKDLTEEEYELCAKKAAEICKRAGKTYILHTYVQTAAKLNCGSVHLPLPLLRQLSGSDEKTEKSSILQMCIRDRC